MFHKCLTGRPYLRATRETQLSPSVLTLCISVMWRAHASFHGLLSRELPAKSVQSSVAGVFRLSLTITHSLHVNLTINTGYNKLNKTTIKFGTKLELTKTHSCKLQLMKNVACFLRKTLVNLLLKNSVICILVLFKLLLNYSLENV